MQILFTVSSPASWHGIWDNTYVYYKTFTSTIHALPKSNLVWIQTGTLPSLIIIHPLQTTNNLKDILGHSLYWAVNTLCLNYKNQSINDIYENIGKQSLVIQRSTKITEIHCMGRMWNFLMLNLVVNKVIRGP